MGHDHPKGADSKSGTPDYRDPSNPLTRSIIRRYSAGEISGRKAAILLGNDASEHDVFELIRTLGLPLPLPPQEEIDRQVKAAMRMLDRLAGQPARRS